MLSLVNTILLHFLAQLHVGCMLFLDNPSCLTITDHRNLFFLLRPQVGHLLTPTIARCRRQWAMRENPITAQWLGHGGSCEPYTALTSASLVLVPRMRGYWQVYCPRITRSARVRIT